MPGTPRVCPRDARKDSSTYVSARRGSHAGCAGIRQCTSFPQYRSGVGHHRCMALARSPGLPLERRTDQAGGMETRRGTADPFSGVPDDLRMVCPRDAEALIRVRDAIDCRGSQSTQHPEFIGYGRKNISAPPIYSTVLRNATGYETLFRSPHTESGTCTTSSARASSCSARKEQMRCGRKPRRGRGGRWPQL